MGGKKRVTPASRSVRDTSDRKLAPSLYAKVEQIIDVSLTSEWDDEEAVQRDEAEREQALAALASNDLARLARRLAAVAAGHGTSDRWQTWLDVMRTAGWSDEGSLASLNETQEYSWFAQWCLTVGQLPELGIEAYERAMADPQGNDLNWFSNQIFFETLLQKGQDRRLEAACDLLAKTKGMTRVGRAYLAATKLRRGAVDDGKRELFALEGVMDEAIVVASVALAWHHGGLEHEAERILLTLNRSAVFNPALEATLDATFGELFARAVARPEPPPRKPRQSSVSFVLRRATRQTPHHFGPEQRDDAPHCHGCERPLISWIRLDIQACRNLRKALPDWGNFEALACLDCNAWMGRHDYRHLPDGSTRLERVVLDDSRTLGKPIDAYAPPNRQHLELDKMGAELGEDPLAEVSQVGGRPLWIQGAVDVLCHRCEELMVYVLRFHQTPEIEACPAVAAGSGALFYFACPACNTSSTIAQWT